MPIAARYADEWNAVFVTPERFSELNAHMDRLLESNHRSPGAMRRTLMHRITVGATDADVARKTEGADVAGLRERGALIGTPNQVAEGLHGFQEVGVQRLMAQLLDMTDLDGVELLGAKVLPQLA